MLTRRNLLGIAIAGCVGRLVSAQPQTATVTLIVEGMT